MTKNVRRSMRITHRYLGFFLVGIMSIYALSGTLMIFRTTDLLKKERTIEKKLEPNIASGNLAEYMGIRGFKVTDENSTNIYFGGGSYDKNTGVAEHTAMRLPLILEKMTLIHKATTNSPLYFLNIFFGTSLLFFVISTFWMFAVKSSPFRRGLYFTLGGILLTLLLMFV